MPTNGSEPPTGHSAGDSVVNRALCGSHRRGRGYRGCLVRGGERLGYRFQRLACGVDAQKYLDRAADQHDRGADQVADEQAGPAGAVADQRAVEGRADGPATEPIAKKTAIASARISIGQVSDTAR